MGGRPVLPTVRTRPPPPPSSAATTTTTTPPRRTYTVAAPALPYCNRLLRTLCSCCFASSANCTCPDGLATALTTVVDGFVYLLGPVLICLATGIAGGLTYTFVTVMLPMMVADPGGEEDGIGSSGGGGGGSGGRSLVVLFTSSFTALSHTILVVFFLINVLHNYALCVTTPNDGPAYQRVVRELAESTGFRYPETQDEVAECKRDYQDKLIERGRRRRAAAVRSRVVAGAGQGGRVGGSEAAGAAAAASGAAASEHVAASAVPIPSPSSPPQQQQSGGPQAAQRRRGAGGAAAASDASAGVDGGSGAAPGAAPGVTASSGAVSAVRRPAAANATAAAAAPTAGGGVDASAPNPPPRALPGWMLMDPMEWGFDLNSDQPKPPRSHYDHVTKMLVLNMDHYCPWMFNTVGYFNYRYFCNFLFYVCVGMLYGFAITLRPFLNMNSSLYREQIKLCKSKGLDRTVHLLHLVPTPDERTALTFSFMICLSVGLAVLCLLGFHCYLLFTAQTTIEFHGNFAKKRGAQRRGTRWTNPYSLGWRRNFQQIYGSRLHPFLAMLPSSREPEFLPVPIAGELGRRHPKSKESVLPVLSIPRGAATSSSMNGSDGTRRRGAVLPV